MDKKYLGRIIFAYSGRTCSTILNKIIDKFIDQEVYIDEGLENDSVMMNIKIYELKDEN